MSEHKAIALEVEIWPIERLIPYEKNAKKHPKEQIQKIAASMREFGWPKAKAIEVDARGEIINGHGRRLAALSLDMTHVPVVVRCDLTPDQVRAYRLADNQVAQSDFDTGLLADELQDLHGNQLFDMSLFYDARDLDFAIDDLGEMDLDALTADIQAEVDAHREEVESKSSAGRKFDLTDALGFKKVTAAQRLVLNRLMVVAEQTTGLRGPDALTSYVEQHCL